MCRIFLLTTVLVCGGCSDDTESLKCTQGEYTGNFKITTQSDVATLAGYTSISGGLEIRCLSCTDLSELSCLTSVGEHLYIWTNPALTNLDGLSGITSVGEDLNIRFNFSLPDCEACNLLDQLTTTPTPINVWGNLDDSCTPVPAGCP